MAMIPRLDIAALEAMPLDSLAKGLPFGEDNLRLGDIKDKGWNLLQGDVPLPAAVIREDIVTANSKWMREFTHANDLLIAPHGKTTMTPQLFDLQIADGAWAITVATVQQMQVCRRFGVKRILLANQPVADLAIRSCLDALSDPQLELYCLVDTGDGLAALIEAAKNHAAAAANPLRILIEAGFKGGRTGVRTEEEALQLAQRAAAAPGLQLAGFECFEGLLPTPDAAAVLVDRVARLAGNAIAAGLFAGDSPVIVSAGGSAFFDRVGERFNQVNFQRPVLKLLRSGCYLTHDTMGYAAAFERMRNETSLMLPQGGLTAALEVWAHVQSRPDQDRAILTLGKRDIGFDAGLPQPMRWFRPGSAMTAPQDMPAGHETVALNDQHCHMTLPAGSPLQYGDMVGFGIGHPCTTFDKWALLYLIDADYRITSGLKTFF